MLGGWFVDSCVWRERRASLKIGGKGSKSNGNTGVWPLSPGADGGHGPGIGLLQIDPELTTIAGMEYCRRYLVSGVVQGVGFRYYTQKQARSLTLVGWVRNRSDGTVEIEARGRRDQLDQMYAWLLHGPAAARVTGVEAEDIEQDEAQTDFSIR